MAEPVVCMLPRSVQLDRRQETRDKRMKTHLWMATMFSPKRATSSGTRWLNPWYIALIGPSWTSQNKRHKTRDKRRERDNDNSPVDGNHVLAEEGNVLRNKMAEPMVHSLDRARLDITKQETRDKRQETRDEKETMKTHL
jgi:hypothetical protein